MIWRDGWEPADHQRPWQNQDPDDVGGWQAGAWGAGGTQVKMLQGAGQLLDMVQGSHCPHDHVPVICTNSMAYQTLQFRGVTGN